MTETTSHSPRIPSQEQVQFIHIVRDIFVAATTDIVFESVLDELGAEGQMPDGTPFPMRIEPWPGGRWYRDLGNSTGHFWGHVQVIKPPRLLEICGPMFMSYPATNFVQYRLLDEGGGTRLIIQHRAMGLIPSQDSENVHLGWDHGLKRVREIAENRQHLKLKQN